MTLDIKDGKLKGGFFKEKYHWVQRGEGEFEIEEAKGRGEKKIRGWDVEEGIKGEGK